MRNRSFGMWIARSFSALPQGGESPLRWLLKFPHRSFSHGRGEQLGPSKTGHDPTDMPSGVRAEKHKLLCNAKLTKHAALPWAWGRARSSQMAGTHTRKNGTILLAEDEELLRELGKTILKQAGYEVVTATGSDELRSLVASYAGEIDLLLTDIVMPGVSGQELVHLVRARWPEVRVLYMSGYSNEDIQDLEQDAGFLQKPFTPTELTAKIGETLSK
jgi:CheY-like chemotaxis protein